MKIDFDDDRRNVEIDLKTKNILDYYFYELEMSVVDTEEKPWRSVGYKLTKEGNLIASGSFHENGAVDATGELVLEHILAFRNEEKYAEQSKALDDVLEQLIELRRKRRFFKFGEKELEQKLGNVMFYRTGWTPEQSDEIKSIIDIALMETYHGEIETILREIKEKNKKISNDLPASEEPGQRE